MRIAGLWQLRDGTLELKPELERTDDVELKERILGFLTGGGMTLRSPGLREDRLDPSQPPRVPVGFRSDGEWIWPLELAHYLERHGILPEKEFIAHMQDREFQALEPSPQELTEAANLLSGS